MTFRSLSLRGPVNWVTDDEPKTSLEKPGTAQTSSDPQWAQMQLLGAVCETFHHPVDQMFHQENSNKGILCVPRRQPEEQQLCLSFCAFHHLLESKGRCWQTAGQGKANRNTDIIQQNSKHRSCQAPSSSQCRVDYGQRRGKLTQKVLEDVAFPFPRCCWYAENSPFCSFSTAGTLQKSNPPCDFFSFCKSAHSAAQFSSLGNEGGVRSYHPAVVTPCRNSQKKFLKPFNCWSSGFGQCLRGVVLTL